MHTTLHRARQPTELHEHVAHRVGLADRIALRLGVALIAWGRRSGLAPLSRERRARRIEQYLARLARERAADREHLLLP